MCAVTSRSAGRHHGEMKQEDQDVAPHSAKLQAGGISSSRGIQSHHVEASEMA